MAAKSMKAAGAGRRASAAAVEAATIVGLDEAGRAEVRVSAPSGRTEPVTARLAAIAGYRPSVGDRVLVAEGGDGAYVIAVLHASRPLSLATPAGATAEANGEAIEVRDPEGRLLVRYAGGVAEITSPERDLRLSAPHGRVVLSAGTDVSIEAARDLQQRAGRRLDLAAGPGDPQIHVEPSRTSVKAARLEVEARASRLVTGEATVLARTIATTAEHVAANVERYELTAARLIEKTRDAFRDVAGLLQSRIGRSRTVVGDTYTLHARRSTLTSDEETTIDGSKILLG
jgi:Protein of unknown function (DUF3540)